MDVLAGHGPLELTRVRQRRQLPLLLAQLASQTAQVLNIAKAAAAIGMEKSTAENYTKLLEAVFLVHQLPSWGTTLGSRVGVAPKIHIVDSGLAARLLRLTDTKLAEASAPALSQFGHLLEVKASSCVRPGELRSLARLRRKLASQFLGGLVLYTGQRAYTHDTSVHVVPLARLWQTPTAT
jgi:uncharacterized protein